MTDEREPDPAEEYFNTLERIMEDTPENRRFLANARENYRINSRYTDEYWRQREYILRQNALERMAARKPSIFKRIVSGFKNMWKR